MNTTNEINGNYQLDIKLDDIATELNTFAKPLQAYTQSLPDNVEHVNLNRFKEWMHQQPTTFEIFWNRYHAQRLQLLTFDDLKMSCVAMIRAYQHQNQLTVEERADVNQAKRRLEQLEGFGDVTLYDIASGQSDSPFYDLTNHDFKRLVAKYLKNLD